MNGAEGARAAVRQLQAREQAAPGNADVKLELALALRAAGEPGRAEAKVREAIRMADGHPRAQHLLGFMLHARGALAEAATHLLRARELHNDVRDPYHLAALALHALRDHAALARLRAPADPAQHFGECVLRAIAAWQDGDRDACGHALATAARLVASAPAAAPNRAAFETYRRFLAELLAAPPAPARPDAPAGAVHAIGDSHSLTAAHRRIDVGHGLQRIESELVFGCMAWHLANPVPTPQSAAFDAAIERCRAESAVLMCFGELDCRSTGGLFKRLRGMASPDLRGEVSRLAAGYVGRLSDRAQRRRLRVIVVTPPASNADDSALSSADRALFRAIAPAFAEALRASARDRGWPVVDLAAATRRPDGAAAAEHYVDSNHVRPDVLVSAARVAGFDAT
ncbi:MAG: hypothetical protein JNK67_01480 [Alphaproteobacteria bacterium]|nr:hypothetical protein [Alphaproteobacteria bacterium]